MTALRGLRGLARHGGRTGGGVWSRCFFCQSCSSMSARGLKGARLEEKSTRELAKSRPCSLNHMSIASLDALLATRGPHGLCDDLRDATTHSLHDVAVMYLSAMMRIDVLFDHVVAHQARSAEAIADALDCWPQSLQLNTVALGGEFKVWRGGMPPFHAPWVPTERLVSAVLTSMQRHQTDRLTISAGVRLLKMHAQSSQRLVLAPRVLTAIAAAMRSYPQDDTVNHWSAEGVVALNKVEPADVIAAHGQASYDAMCITTIQLALTTLRPATLLISGTAWHDMILLQFPRLRSQARVG
jgi:hypothetical protein